MDVRKVYLLDENGSRVDCLLRSSFFNDLSGLGYDDQISYLNYGDGFFSPIKRESKQGAVQGKMSFLDNATAYANYRTLMDWVSLAETYRTDYAIKLCYCPYGADTFTKNVILTSVSKGELDVGGFLSCNVTFTSLTPWYTVTAKTVTSTTIGGVAGYNLTLNLSDDLDGRYLMTIGGTFSKMTIRFRDSTNTSYGLMDLSSSATTFSGTDKLVFSTLPGNIGIWKDSSGTLTNLIDQIKFTSGLEVFPLLKKRQNLTIMFRTASSADSFSGTANIYSYWKTR